jgi:hypothetical protein
MNTREKIVQVRKLLGIPDHIRIYQHILNQVEAHDYAEPYYMPDDVFMSLCEEKEDFAKTYQRIRQK